MTTPVQPGVDGVNVEVTKIDLTRNPAALDRRIRPPISRDNSLDLA
ncbi:MAG: hypothetical protein QM747_03900 [Nocardioides sp.]